MFAPKSPEATIGLSENVSVLRYSAMSTEPFEAPSVIRSLMMPDMRVLDIGCGTGAMTMFLKEQGIKDILCIEPNAVRAAEARAAGLVVITGYYDDQVPVNHGRFDCILLIDVLEHLVDPGKLLIELEGALADGGVVIASVPNVAHWSIRFNLLKGRFDYAPSGLMDATHLRWFTKATLVKLFQSTGYNVRRMSRTAGAWLPVYQRLPFRLLGPTKPQVIYKLGQYFHGLLACQHIVLATRSVIELATPRT